MLPFQTLLLRRYWALSEWNEDALFSNLTRSSSAILDFPVPTSVELTLSNAPVDGFLNSFEATALPLLRGSLAYVATSRPLGLEPSETVPFRSVVDTFKVHDMPQRAPDRPDIWHRGVRVDERDYMIYGRTHLPSWRVDGLYTTRWSPTLQSVFAFVHIPSSTLSHNPPSIAASGGGPSASLSTSQTSSSPSTTRVPSKFLGNVLLQHSVGRYSSEWSYSVDDGLFGVRSLYNFAPSSRSDVDGGASATGGSDSSTAPLDVVQQELDGSFVTVRKGGRPRRVDEEDALMPGLRGRFSVGAECYLSMKEKSGGLCFAGRFCTLPDTPVPSSPSSPIPSSSFTTSPSPPPTTPTMQPAMTATLVANPLIGHVSAAYTSQVGRDLTVSSRFDFNLFSYEGEWTVGGEWFPRKTRDRDREAGVMKAVASTTGDVSLLYVTRLSNVLLSLGVVSDLGSRLRPVKGVGLELHYFA